MTAPVAAPDTFFWDAARAGHLAVQQCADCGVFRHPPRPMCGACGSQSSTATKVSGRGTVYSWVLPRHPIFSPGDPRVAVLVELEEGVRIVSNLVGIALEDIALDLPVEVFFEERNGTVVPQFRPR
jgi:uncharacterized OB-fold protein